MANLAILVGNVHYQNLADLNCCHDDLIAIEGLLKATEKYDSVVIIEDADADSLKTQIRSTIDKLQSVEELFFYFTGHGHQHEVEFYFCPTNFDSRRPNETGLSTTELHTLLRLADAGLVAKVVDACNSGTLLVKSDWSTAPDAKSGFKNLVQISSCLESQNSLTGDPLSAFTEKFRAAVLRKTEGVVYYTDVINTLRDEFNENNLQTPFFVTQGTGREKFVEDATKLNALREVLRSSAREIIGADIATPPTLLDRLRMADSRVVTPQILSTFTDAFLNDLAAKLSTSDFADFFNIESVEHSGFQESTAEKFIIRVLSKEKRVDNFVTASHSRVMRNRNGLLGSLDYASLLGGGVYDDQWELFLNCEMSRAQVKYTLTPKFLNLQRINLVVSCAPSLDYCYIFEITTQHMLQDFGKYDEAGAEVSRRWWKVKWSGLTAGVSSQIAQVLSQTVRSHLDAAEKRLAEAQVD